MKPELIDSFDPINESDIRNFERELSFALPEDYRDFLLTTNGGIFHDEVYDGNIASVEVLYGIVPKKLQGYFADLRWSPFFNDNTTLLRFGNSDLNDQLLLQLGNEQYGSVWMHHVDFDSTDDETTIRPVARSFTDFLSSLRLHPDRDISEESDALFRAIEDGDSDAFFYVFRFEDIYKRSDDDWPILSFAAFHHRLQIMKHLITSGAEIEAADSRGETPLFYAVRGQSVDTPRLLIEHGADVNAINANGDSVLIVALGAGNERGALLLVESGADVHFQSPSGKTALDCTCSRDPLVRSWLDGKT